MVFDEKICEVAQKYLNKGSTVYLEGALQTRKWTDQQGQDKYTTEVVLNRFRGELQMLDSRQGGGNNQQPEQSSQDGGGDDLDDEEPW